MSLLAASLQRFPCASATAPFKEDTRLPGVLNPACVRLVKWVAALAMGLVGIGRLDGVAPKRVHANGDDLQVARVHTSAIAAEVVDDHSCTNRPVHHLIRKSVRSNATPCLVSATADKEVAIPISVEPVQPAPATGGFSADCSLKSSSVGQQLLGHPLGTTSSVTQEHEHA